MLSYNKIYDPTQQKLIALDSQKGKTVLKNYIKQGGNGGKYVAGVAGVAALVGISAYYTAAKSKTEGSSVASVWVCPVCNAENGPKLTQCIACGSARSMPPTAEADWAKAKYKAVVKYKADTDWAKAKYKAVVKYKADTCNEYSKRYHSLIKNPEDTFYCENIKELQNSLNISNCDDSRYIQGCNTILKTCNTDNGGNGGNRTNKYPDVPTHFPDVPTHVPDVPTHDQVVQTKHVPILLHQ